MRNTVLFAAALAMFLAAGVAANADPAAPAAATPAAATPAMPATPVAPASPVTPVTTATATVAATPASPEDSDLDKIVCHTRPPVVGTLLGAKRECATQREWRQRSEDAQKQLSDSQTHTFVQGR